jgi:hypothetical protein
MKTVGWRSSQGAWRPREEPRGSGNRSHHPLGVFDPSRAPTLRMVHQSDTGVPSRPPQSRSEVALNPVPEPYSVRQPKAKSTGDDFSRPLPGVLENTRSNGPLMCSLSGPTRKKDPRWYQRGSFGVRVTQAEGLGKERVLARGGWVWSRTAVVPYRQRGHRRETPRPSRRQVADQATRESSGCPWRTLVTGNLTC